MNHNLETLKYNITKSMIKKYFRLYVVVLLAHHIWYDILFQL